ncbi:SpoIIE family protein phosphatase [uncultured Microscilla sp.]|uniref:SpoIIE family protein phosphatase n=1 Tax=uncultured Microscilla sp. TaxID=432653 RepID=UPI00262D0D92|nr:SpoIIE family protein phosphatase [uncultured Microscilla sp.]
MKQLIEQCIPHHLIGDDNEKTKARIFVFSGVAVSLLGLIMILLYLTVVPTPASNFIATFILFVFSLLLLVYFKKTGNLKIAANALITFGFLALNVSVIDTGGIYSMDLIWLVAFPCGAFLFLNNKSAFWWTAASISVTVIYLIIAFTAPKLLGKVQFDPIYNFVSVCLCIAIVISIIYYFVKQNQLYSLVLAQKNEKLEKTQEEMIAQNIVLQERQEEIATQNEELIQNQEEIIAQRDFIEVKNRALENRDNQISHSIRAAQVIQQAILPNAHSLQLLLGDHFIVFRPRDVVSGDFYWVNKVQGQTVLASVDCTGHGVPGAFISLIGHNLLDKVILQQKITDPSIIINTLHTEIVHLLKQEAGRNNYGMDLTVCAWQHTSEGCQLAFCGAKNSFYYTLPHQSGYIALKGTRKSVGGIQPENIHFTNQSVCLPSGSMFYIGSDGIEDQNDKKRKKLGTKKVLRILSDAAHLPTAEQKLLLENSLQQHMEGTTQRDDILLIGVRV